MQPIGLLSNLKLCQLKKVSEQSEWYLCRLFSCSFRAFALPHMENKCIFRKTEYIFGDFECVSCTGHFNCCCCCLSDVCHFGWKVHFPGCQQFIIVFAFVCVRMDEWADWNRNRTAANKPQLEEEIAICLMFHARCVCVCVFSWPFLHVWNCLWVYLSIPVGLFHRKSVWEQQQQQHLPCKSVLLIKPK